MGAHSAAMDDHIPPLTSAADVPPVRTQEDLHRLWRMLMGPLGFGGRSLWVHLLDAAGRPTPVILQVEDLPPLPDLGLHDGLRCIVDQLADGTGGSIAFLLTRPGRDGITVSERRWAVALTDVVRRAGLHVWPVHWANDVELGVVAPDDLAVSA